jgi:hypothetical protein
MRILGVTASGFDGGDYELIATVFATGESNIISFTSIPQTYKHLQIRYVARGTNAAQSSLIYLLRNSSGNPRTHRLLGNGSSVSSDSPTAAVYASRMPAASATSGSHGGGIIDILDYSSGSKFSTIRTLGGFHAASALEIGLYSGFWVDSTSAINSFSLVNSDGNFTNTSRFSLYGIRG